MNISREAVVHPNASLRFLRLELDEFRGERHRHRHLELTWIERGAGIRCVGDSMEPFDDGDLVLLGPDLPHQWSTARRLHAGPRAATVVQFAPSLCLQPALPEMAALVPRVRRAAPGLAVTGDTHARVTQALRAMHARGGLDRLVGLLAALGHLLRGGDDLRPLSRTAPPVRAGDDAPAEPHRIDRVLDWMNAHLAQPLTVEDAARVAHVSPGAFCRFFRREAGRPFTEVLNDARCSAAWVRLLHSNDAVALVARDCGFATLSHFNAQFRARYGLSPREARRGAGAGR
jgi:AraC-like DNA-binding protein